MNKSVSPRGVYYDLEQSPYVYESPYGISFKFSSQARLESFHRHVVKSRARYCVMIKKIDILTIKEQSDILSTIYKRVYQEVYAKVEGIEYEKEE